MQIKTEVNAMIPFESHQNHEFQICIEEERDALENIIVGGSIFDLSSSNDKSCCTHNQQYEVKEYKKTSNSYHNPTCFDSILFPTMDCDKLSSFVDHAQS